MQNHLNVLLYPHFTEENGRKVLNLGLSDSVSIGSLEGSRVTIKFSSSLDILQATEKVYGQTKNRVSDAS